MAVSPTATWEIHAPAPSAACWTEKAPQNPAAKTRGLPMRRYTEPRRRKHDGGTRGAVRGLFSRTACQVPLHAWARAGGDGGVLGRRRVARPGRVAFRGGAWQSPTISVSSPPPPIQWAGSEINRIGERGCQSGWQYPAGRPVPDGWPGPVVQERGGRCGGPPPAALPVRGSVSPWSAAAGGGSTRTIAAAATSNIGAIDWCHRAAGWPAPGRVYGKQGARAGEGIRTPTKDPKIVFAARSTQLSRIQPYYIF